jgi:hypothetical protein
MKLRQGEYFLSCFAERYKLISKIIHSISEKNLRDML